MFWLHPKCLPEYLDGRICVQENSEKWEKEMEESLNGFTHLELHTAHNVHVLWPN